MYEREAAYRQHSPACTCVTCNQKRLRRQRPLLRRLFSFLRRKL